MATRIGTGRRKSRHKFRKHFRSRGKISITRFLQPFKEGDRVWLHAEPGVQKGLYHARFHGKAAIVKGKQGSCYQVEFKDGKKLKQLVIHPVHLDLQKITAKEPEKVLSGSKDSAAPSNKLEVAQ